MGELDIIMGKKQLNNNFTFIDLFAGIGGIRIAFERVGGKCIFSSEWDKAAQDTYEANFGHRPAGDITKIDAKEIPDHDILTGGFPCQAFSIIGDRLGFADTRGTLFFDVERILKEKQPKAFLLENVKQLVGHDKGRTFKIILDKLQRLGYFVHYKVLNGLYFGVPQKRERIIIVGFKENYPFEFPTKNNGKSLTLSDILVSHKVVDKKYFLSNYFKKNLDQRLKDQGKEILSRPVILHENKSRNIGINSFSCALRSNGSHNYLVVDGIRRLTPREMFRLQGFPNSYKIIGNDSQAKKQAGNAVVVPKIQAVATAMIAAMSKKPIKLIKQDELFKLETINANVIYA